MQIIGVFLKQRYLPFFDTFLILRKEYNICLFIASTHQLIKELMQNSLFKHKKRAPWELFCESYDLVS